ncbi:hypothetical protein RvY_06134 [Ramazzottius varieornatus]|uniref:Uncharacterized protein n=1 Tax=Ramazzottius varieornatus TaxID=947166 RepID=A0A1D1V6A9_RAMVA|nr:hypothetical protein RvY_06134 [Ramazzottius varieornatus]
MAELDAPLLITREYEKSKEDHRPTRQPRPESVSWLLEDMYVSTARVSLALPNETIKLLNGLADTTRRYFKAFNAGQAPLESRLEEAGRKLSLKEYELTIVQNALASEDNGFETGYFAEKLTTREKELLVKPTRLSGESDSSVDSGSVMDDIIDSGNGTEIIVSREWADNQLSSACRSLGALTERREIKFWIKMLRSNLSVEKTYEEARESSLKRAIDWFVFLEDMLHTKLYEPYTRLLARQKQLNVLGVFTFIEEEVFPRLPEYCATMSAICQSLEDSFDGTDGKILRKLKWNTAFDQKEAQNMWETLRESSPVFIEMGSEKLAALVDRFASAAAGIPVSEEEPSIGRDVQELRKMGQDRDGMLLVLLHALCQLVPCQCYVPPYSREAEEHVPDELDSDEELF